MILCCITACGGGSALPNAASGLLAAGPTVAGRAPRAAAATVNSAGTDLAIDAGSATAVGAWASDSGYANGGWDAASTSSISMGAVTNPAPLAVYQSQRLGTALTYTIPSLTPNAAYNVRLHFAETFFNAAKQRLFNVSINGTPVLTGFDIFAAAGGKNVAIAKSFAVNADAAGKLTITMTATVNNAALAAIEVSSASATPSPSPSPSPAPVLLAIDSGTVSAPAGWSHDEDYTTAGAAGSWTISSPVVTSGVANAAPEAVYQTQRWARQLTYTIPALVPNAPYTVRLHFAETYFSAAGKRVFNITLNGVSALTNFDIFQAAGGADRAVVEQFTPTASAAGTLTIALAASVNNAQIAGLEIIGGASGPTPTPSPTPSPTPTPGGDTLPWVFSELYNTTSPLLTPMATLKAQGATIVPHQYMDSFWTQGFPTRPVATDIPLYASAPTDRVVTVSCGIYGICNANGVRIHENANDYVQDINGWNNPNEDHHLLLIDQNSSAGPVELDCWQAGPRNSSDNIVGNTLSCSWAGLYSLGTDGLHGTYPNQTSPGMNGIHFGPAAGTFMVTGTELANGHIDHALALNVSCLNNPSVYPADTSAGTDTACDGSNNPPHYGNAIHLLWTPAQIAASAYGAPCKTILTALATYGAYMSDTGDVGVVIDVEAEKAYTSVGAVDPYPGITAQLQASGDANGSGQWTNCFNRLQSSDFEMIQLAAS